MLIPVPDEFSTEPEPDIAVTRAPASANVSDSPGADDILFIAEISDSSLAYDLGYKAVMYAAAGIPEYWVLDIMGRQVTVHRQPSERGFGEITTYGDSEEVATLARPEHLVGVASLFPEITK